MKDYKVETTVMNSVNEAIEIFEKYGIKTRLNKDNLIIISHYEQPKEKTFSELGINEDELIKNVVACEGVFDARKSSLTKFPLEASREIRLYEDTNITEMPNLKAVGALLTNSKLKKLPKLKAVGSISFENSPLRSLPKLKEAKIFIAQNSMLEELPSLERVGKLCIVDCPLEDLKSLEVAENVFICSSDENLKINLKSLPKFEEVQELFVANSSLKTLPKLKKAKKLAFYNCEVKSVKPSVCKDFEIETHINDEKLSEKFDVFTNWYNSEVLDNTMDLLGSIVSRIKS